MQRASYESFRDAKRFFVEIQSDEGDITVPISLRTACVVITTVFGDKVGFSKTNRSKSGYRDWRGKKTERKNEWGDKKVGKAPLMLSESDCKAELERLLDDVELARQAFNALQV